jgi:magnesium transporter
MRYKDYINLLIPIFNTRRTRDILSVNPVIPKTRVEAAMVKVSVFIYHHDFVEELQFEDIASCLKSIQGREGYLWINVDGISTSQVSEICQGFNIHPLLLEDILSNGQRPKMDEINSFLFCLLNMLYFNENSATVEQEQISIVLGENLVLSFQEDPSRDVFNSLRDKLKMKGSKIRQAKADFLCYTMIDLIVDHYFLVMEKLGERIEQLEEEVIRNSNTRSLAKINRLRKELIVLKRNIQPVRELVYGFIRSESDLLEDRTTKYFKDVYDHILQASDLAENYRDVMINLQDLYISNVNLKMNEVMKVMAIVTCLLAPATVIGGIFGMNFEVIPYSHHQNGFYIAVGFMMLVPIYMLWIFRKRGWF